MKDAKRLIKAVYLNFGLFIIALWTCNNVNLIVKFAGLLVAALLTPLTLVLSTMYLLGYFTLFIPFVWGMWYLDRKIYKIKKRKKTTKYNFNR